VFKLERKKDRTERKKEGIKEIKREKKGNERRKNT
jgi:hypothetical protein